MIFIEFILNFFQNSFSKENSIYIDEIQTVYQRLAIDGKEGACAIFEPRKARKKDADILNIQFSIRNGKIGLDWILQNTFNISQQAIFLAAAKAVAYEVTTIENNGLTTLRVEGENSALICRQLFANIYGIYGNKTIKLYVEGFIYPGRKKA